jgi:hypothetical protein
VFATKENNAISVKWQNLKLNMEIFFSVYEEKSLVGLT